MKLTDRQLIGLPVQTVAGESVGRVVGLECDSEHHLILNYQVSASPLVARWLGVRNSVLIIGRLQVVSLDNERMVVADAVVTEDNLTNAALAAQAQSAPLTNTLLK